MPTRPIRFFHRGRLHEVADVAPTCTVLDWLRQSQHRCGTKEGCNEGDCGACTVLIARRGGAGLQLRSANACLMLLPMLDGKALLTVEDLAGPDGALHPAQQALVDCHGSQCGFCTPGFVMTLAGVLAQQAGDAPRPTRQALADALAGNLCRCTGYRPILAAAERMFDLPGPRPDLAALQAALATLADDPPLHYAGPNPAHPVDGQPRTDHFHAPRALEEFARLRAERAQARLLAGATDVALWLNKQLRDLGELHFIGEVAALQHCRRDGAALRIGAAVSLEDAWAALAQALPALREMWLRFASPPVRHAGTLAGNLANGSPIGDGAPVLMALDARLVLRHGAAQRELALDGFYLDYMKNRLAPGEFIAEVVVPLPGEGTLLRAWKVAKRHDSDISAVCAAFALRLDGERIADVRLAFGGLAATVRRAAQAEAALRGQPWTEATLQAAQAALAQDFQPLTDLRASAGYRRRVAANLLRRLWLQTAPQGALQGTLQDAATTVWRHAAPGAAQEAA